jgi:hypothetical protein
MTPPTRVTRVCPDIKAALQDCSALNTLKLSGLWHVPSLRELKEITAQFSHPRRIEVQGLQFHGANIHLELFNHIFQAFPELEDLELGVRIEAVEVINSLKAAATAAPSRFYKSLAILPYSITGSHIHYFSVEADILSTLLSSAFKGNPTLRIGMNAPTFAELVHYQKYLDLQYLSLAFPLELHRDTASTDNFLASLPSAFVHENTITSLELITLWPYALVMAISTAQDLGLPFPMLRTLRIANPGWYQDDGDREKAEAQAPILREAMAERGVTFEWENVDRYPTPKQVLQEVSGHASWIVRACLGS